MKNMIAVAKRDKENKKPLIIENINKSVIIKVTKVSNTIDFDNKYSWVISNMDIDTIRDLKLTDIKKY